MRGVALAVAGEVEDAGAFHEERTLLGEEDREALVDLDLERVALDLTEVGIDRRVEGDRRRQAPLHADAEIAAGCRHAPVAGASRAPGRARTWRDGMTSRVGRGGDVGRTPASRASGRPTCPARAPATTTETPTRLTRRQNRTPICTSAPPLKRMRLQRQPDLDRVAGVGDAPGAVPHPVGRGVFAAAARVEHVELDAARIDHQVVGQSARCRARRG